MNKKVRIGKSFWAKVLSFILITAISLCFATSSHAKEESRIDYKDTSIETLIANFLDDFDSLCNGKKAEDPTLISYFADATRQDSALTIKQLEASIAEKQAFIQLKPNLVQQNLERNIDILSVDKSDKDISVKVQVMRVWNYPSENVIESGSVIEVKEVQYAKAPSPIDITELGIIIVVKLVALTKV